MHGKKPQSRTVDTQDPPLPLYLPNPLGTINVELLAKDYAQAFPKNTKNLDEAMQWLNNEDKYEKLLEKTPKRKRSSFPNRNMENHRDELLASGLLVKTPKNQIKAWCKVFKIPEKRKKRSRLIIESRTLNRAWKTTGKNGLSPYPRTRLPQVSHVRSMESE